MAHRGVLAAAASALGVLAACSPAGDAREFPRPSPSAPPVTASPQETASADAAAVDCEAVEQARQELAEATNAELARLGVDRSDPRAFSVQVLVTSQQAAEYWGTVADALPASDPGMRSDVQTVVRYWDRLNAQLDAIEIEDATEASLQEATERYLRVSAQHPETEVLPVQQRLTAQVDAACTGAAG